MLGPAWTGRGRPPGGYFTKRLAEDWLRDTLDELRFAAGYATSRPLEGAQHVPGPRSRGDAARPRSAATFADAAEEYLRFAEQDRGCRPSTLRGYRNAIRVHLLPVFGGMPIEDITVSDVEQWRAGMAGIRTQRELSNKTKNNLLVLMHAIFRHAVKLYDLPANPLASVDRFRVRSSGDIQVFSPEEVWALVRAASSETDAAIYLTAAFTGLRRGELLALRWRDVDFAGSTIRVRASYAAGQLTTPKSGTVRAVPMAPDVAGALAKLGRSALTTTRINSRRSSSSAQAPTVAALRFVRDLQRWGEHRLRVIPAQDATARVVRILTKRGRLAARVDSPAAISVRMAPAGRLGEYVATSVVGNFLVGRRGRDWRVVSLPGD